MWTINKLVKTMLLLILACFTINGFASNLWECHAQDKRGATWSWNAATRAAAASHVRSSCAAGSVNAATCRVWCNPPMWHCVAHNSAGRTWSWNAADKATAIDKARQACRANSRTPALANSCTVNVGECT